MFVSYVANGLSDWRGRTLLTGRRTGVAAKSICSSVALLVIPLLITSSSRNSYKALRNAKVQKLPRSWENSLDARNAIYLNRTASRHFFPADTYCDICGYGDNRLFRKHMFSKDDHLMCCSNCHLRFDEEVRPLLHAALKKAGVCFLPVAWK